MGSGPHLYLFRPIRTPWTAFRHSLISHLRSFRLGSSWIPDSWVHLGEKGIWPSFTILQKGRMKLTSLIIRHRPPIDPERGKQRFDEKAWLILLSSRFPMNRNVRRWIQIGSRIAFIHDRLPSITLAAKREFFSINVPQSLNQQFP